jgi:hypothetical protein
VQWPVMGTSSGVGVWPVADDAVSLESLKERRRGR